MPSSKRFGGRVRNSPSLICDDPPSLKLRRTGNNLCLYPMRFVKGRNVLAVSSWQAAGYEKNGPELGRKIRGGRRSPKRVNLCKCLIINRRTLHYFLFPRAHDECFTSTKPGVPSVDTPTKKSFTIHSVLFAIQSKCYPSSVWRIRQPTNLDRNCKSHSSGLSQTKTLTFKPRTPGPAPPFHVSSSTLRAASRLYIRRSFAFVIPTNRSVWARTGSYSSG